MIKRIYSDEFYRLFNGTIILDRDIEKKIEQKHHVYRTDIEDGLGDPYLVVARNARKSPLPESRSGGKLYEIYCETSSRRILFVVGRLFTDGNLYIITSYWAGNEQVRLYYQESEGLHNE
ncbi:MAG TPA: hypothetical protein VMW83_06855 [Spirochaetia bacterium]|nr:hypothetical protein [Spirochaetia bacterium]